MFLLDAADNLLSVEVNIAGDTLRMGTLQAPFHVVEFKPGRAPTP